MPSLRQLITLSLLAATVNAAFGPAFSTGPTASGVYIYSSTATLTLPNGPSGASSGYDLSLWVGMGTSDGDLIQSITDNYNEDWTVFAYTLKETSSTSQEVIEGPVAPAAAGDEVTMVYQYVASTGNYTQTVYLNGVVVSTLSTSDGEAEGWGSAVECASDNCGTVPAHKWTNVEIVLSAADPGYIDTMYLEVGAEASMSTSDGGKTWNVGTISIPQYTF
ncbi:uncharacterized protein PAC_16778 [Phialocephala subalpina]|uniref:Fucose-specific lectin n=1 Tax=Phialocephala subalpina TaxID=576137 RepID=A0A1L7XPH6_9HELO|nr:uncharacterized protein PAC_16778 [Phialocephala subalpina]